MVVQCSKIVSFDLSLCLHKVHTILIEYNITMLSLLRVIELVSSQRNKYLVLTPNFNQLSPLMMAATDPPVFFFDILS